MRASRGGVNSLIAFALQTGKDRRGTPAADVGFSYPATEVGSESKSESAFDYQQTFTLIQTVNRRDAQVIDNGDGTLTIVVQLTGGLRAYDTNGNFVLADPGQIRFQFVVDTGGTLDDPSDDQEIERSFQIVRESTKA